MIVDTHVLLWWGLAPERLSRRAKTVLADPAAALTWSVASTWELAIQHRAGKLLLPRGFESFIAQATAEAGLDVLPVENRHAVRVADLPLHHRDPFDRLLIAQAEVEGIPILTADRRFRQYDAEVVW